MRAADKIRALMTKHALGYLHNPGGGEFNRHDLGRCQVPAEEEAEDLIILLAWLRAKGLETGT